MQKMPSIIQVLTPVVVYLFPCRSISCWDKILLTNVYSQSRPFCESWKGKAAGRQRCTTRIEHDVLMWAEAGHTGLCGWNRRKCCVRDIAHEWQSVLWPGVVSTWVVNLKILAQTMQTHCQARGNQPWIFNRQEVFDCELVPVTCSSFKNLVHSPKFSPP